MTRSAKVESVKQRLKNLRNKEGLQFDDLLRIYFFERFLYRLSISKYKDKFVLKGGILLYAVFDENFARKTSDIDLLAQKIDNDANTFIDIIKEICSIKTDDPIRFDLDNIIVKNITEFKGAYHGLNCYIPAFLDRTQGRINIDIGFDDVIYPCKMALNFPTLIDEEPKLYAYSIETVIAEKLEAIVSIGVSNSRLKDFYDIYVLSQSHDFKGSLLREAVVETFRHRGTPFKHVDAFDDEFITLYRIKQWNSFIHQKSPKRVIDLNMVITKIKKFAKPIFEDSINQLNWNHSKEEWSSTEL